MRIYFNDKCYIFDDPADIVFGSPVLFLRFPKSYCISQTAIYCTSIQPAPPPITQTFALICTVFLYCRRWRHLHSVGRSHGWLFIQVSWPMTVRQGANVGQWGRSATNTNERRALTDVWWMGVKRRQIVTKIATPMTCLHVTRYRNL